MADNMVQVRRARGRLFESGPQVKVGRSQFDRSHTLKTTFDASDLVPILVDEVLPGDTATCNLYGFVRMFSPLLSPVMDNIEVETFFFFVPNRLVWTNWEYFMGAHDQAGAQDTTYTIPVLNTNNVYDAGTSHEILAHYLGVPHGLNTNNINISALPFRAYNRIYNEWFRDQNIIDEVNMETGNGPDSSPASKYVVLKSAKKHDYFTSALPYLQKGTAQTVSLSGSLDVRMTNGTTGDFPSIYADDAGQYRYLEHSAVADERVDIDATQDATGTEKLYVDLSDAGVLNINDLRQSVAIQRLLERDARGGTRYVESIWAHFGVRSPDYRLQRPEYLGGGKSFINISPVANTSGVDATVSISGADEPQGELRGVATGVIQGHGWAKSFTEHGYIIGLVRARGDVTYFQGVHKHWTRSTRYDFYYPALAHLGEQAVLNQEIFVSNDSNDALTFGYQERWSEYRYKASWISGKFDPNYSGALSEWHLAEDFSSLPSLNQTFIEDATPMSRVEAVTTEPDFLMDLRFDYKWARPMPVFGIPALSGRF